MKSHAFSTFADKTRAESWREIPTSYLLCEDDMTIPAAAQESMTRKVKETGADIEVKRIKSDHSPFLGCPEVVVQWIRETAGEAL